MKEPKKIKLSASQFKNYKRCPRRWHFDKVLKQKEPRTKALMDGSKFHGIIEHILLETPFTKDYDDETINMVMGAFESGCIDFEEEEFYVEKKIAIDIDEFHSMTGFIDLLLIGDGYVTIVDHKTISDFHWALTEETLKKDLQLMVYGKWVIENYEVDVVNYRHNQIYKKDSLKSKKVQVSLTRTEIEEYWKKLVAVSKYIHRTRSVELSEEVKTCNGCNDYGGCYFLKAGHCTGHEDTKVKDRIKKLSKSK